MAHRIQRKFSEVEGRCFLKIGERFLDDLALRRGSRLRVERDEPSLFGMRENSG
jgi:hypothetical protein